MEEEVKIEITDVDQDTRFMLEANANLVIELMQPITDFEFGFDEKSLKWFDGYIERLKNDYGMVDNGNRDRFVSIFSSFLGEVFIRNIGGSWKYLDGCLGVLLLNGDCVFAFTKTEKQLANEHGNSIYGLYSGYKALFKLKHAKPTDAEELIDEDGKTYGFKYTYSIEDDATSGSLFIEQSENHKQHSEKQEKKGLFARLSSFLRR